MSKSLLFGIVASVAVVALLGGLAWAADAHKGHAMPKADPAAQATPMAGQCGMKPAGAGQAACHSEPCPSPAESLTALDAHLAAVGQALQAGQPQAATARLAQAQAALAQLRQIMQHCPMMQQAQGPVNATCPIMGSPIDPQAVTPALSRTFQGRTVAFCCGGCPAQWDRLSDAQKLQKLKAASPAPKANPHALHGQH